MTNCDTIMEIQLDKDGMFIEVNPYTFIPCLTGMIAGTITAYWQSRVCLEIAKNINNFVNSKSVDGKWVRLIADIHAVLQMNKDNFEVQPLDYWMKDVANHIVRFCAIPDLVKVSLT